MLDFIPDIVAVYQEIDTKIAQFQMASGLFCPDRCGHCCESNNVEATVLETLPLASEILSKNAADGLLPLLENRAINGATRCVIYSPKAGHPGEGRCSFYEFRPLVCRLFGYAGRRNRKGILEPCFCRPIKDRHPDSLERFHTAVSKKSLPPFYQDFFIRIASMHPIYGIKLLPVNAAIREGLNYLQMKIHPFSHEAA